VAANAVLFSVQFGQDARFASKTVAFSTLFSILTLPLFAAAAEMILR
jgi:predicted permease